MMHQRASMHQLSINISIGRWTVTTSTLLTTILGKTVVCAQRASVVNRPAPISYHSRGNDRSVHITHWHHASNGFQAQLSWRLCSQNHQL
jgi:hypothetical protein